MSFIGFILGAVMMAVGIMAVWKTEFWLRNFGDISELFGAMNARWVSWKIFGTVLAFLGFLIAFNLFGALFMMTLGRLFAFGQLPG
ncbi:MAG: hypothetical protein U1C49_03140 [Candidatus Andersenbacteria bacterium]|nr:hypothetical protein [bacterium]MDZ4225822.1 hypothetical protein [Candidatus Andersenbacteria bacterium]